MCNTVFSVSIPIFFRMLIYMKNKTNNETKVVLCV